jgi:hypothetical protein
MLLTNGWKSPFVKRETGGFYNGKKELFNISQNESYLNPEKLLKIYKTTERVLHNRRKNIMEELKLFTIIFGTEY